MVYQNPQGPAPSLRGKTYAQAKAEFNQWQADKARLEALTAQNKQKLEYGEAGFALGMTLQLGAAIIGSIAAYHGVQAQQADYRTKALNAQSVDFMSQLGASEARIVASQIDQAGALARRQLGQAAAQEQAAGRVSQRARGLTNAGSSAEVQASRRYKQQAEELTIDTNTMRQRQSAERKRLSMMNRARQARVDATNYMDMASSLSPGLAAATSLMQGLAQAGMSAAGYYGSK